MTDIDQLTGIIRQWAEVFTAHSMHAWTRYVRASGLSMSQFGILMRLHYQHSCGVSEISEQMDVSAAAASQLVDKLVQGGLLERAEDPSDRRAKLLTLSARGLALIESGIEARSSWADELVAALNPGEYETVAAALSALTRAASRLETRKMDVRTEKIPLE